MLYVWYLVLLYIRQLGTWCHPRHPHILSVLSIFSSPLVFRLHQFEYPKPWVDKISTFISWKPQVTSPHHHIIAIYIVMNEWHFKPYSFLYCLLPVKYSTFKMHMFYMPILYFLNKAAPLGNGLSSGHLMFSFFFFNFHICTPILQHS